MFLITLKRITLYVFNTNVKFSCHGKSSHTYYVDPPKRQCNLDKIKNFIALKQTMMMKWHLMRDVQNRGYFCGEDEHTLNIEEDCKLSLLSLVNLYY